ncbi:Poly [ADP-ribose] polymerase 4 [Takifugu flavidus]|uniref:Poly [ADP-ribose] polymerase n=2 Tax=Takifugu flavidus TaxID=433684 RepID=A0A5C6PNB2_9TELE|nr:Poly [ADP-ribose] polymerase 4 [Takifugu flavidus]
MPFREHRSEGLQSVSQKLDVCQLIRDVLNVSEMTLRSAAPSCLGKYRALRCSVEAVPADSSEFLDVAAQLRHSQVQIQQVLRVCRGVELQTFKADVGNVKPLLHSSKPSNFVGLLSRGLLMPRVGVEHHGIKRTDVGNLGSGIYFSDAFSTSLKYSQPSATDGSRLLLVCDVALGQCKDVSQRDPTLTEAPQGFHSVHGVRGTPAAPSEFEDDEYVVYSPDQVRLKYVVQFCMEGDRLKEFSPTISTTAEPCLPSTVQELRSEDVEVVKDPLEDVKSGLLDSSGQQIPLQAVHVKCKLMDLLCQVIVFQKYTNDRPVPIEAKYVFPLSDSAAVCGFEAFINGKHVVGQVKEKEAARREYRQAVERGHGAYLMDQDAPDVFTISVGNLPPAASVLIKVTFVSELMVKDGSVLFSLPGSVAPWQESAALNQTTQVTMEKVCVADDAAGSREFSLDASVQMPNQISSLGCITHRVKIKRTDCKAVVSVLPGQVLGPEGFQLSVRLAEVHLPRMWVEKHPEKESQACMLVFYPDFDISSGSPSSNEVVLLLDTSESMGDVLQAVQEIALRVLKALHRDLKVNIILFGTDHSEAFLTAQPLGDVYEEAKSFIKRFTPVGGSTELWRPLRALGLLPPSRGIRNLLLLSDGHIQNPELTLQLLRDGVQHSRLFACGLSPTANRHMLRALAQAGGGAFEFFDTKTKHTWTEKAARQVKRMAAPGCSSVSVKWQQFSPTAPPPVQAPQQLHALFSDCHTLVYGFVPHCTQATLCGNLSGKELQTMVSTSELQKTRGTFLHKLTARAVIQDYEDGNLDADEAQHEGKKAELREFIVGLSKEFSILSQFTSFVAIEERGSAQEEGFTDIPKLIAEEDVDFLPYISWSSPQTAAGQEEEEVEGAVYEVDSSELLMGLTIDCSIQCGGGFDFDANFLMDDFDFESETGFAGFGAIQHSPTASSAPPPPPPGAPHPPISRRLQFECASLASPLIRARRRRDFSLCLETEHPVGASLPLFSDTMLDSFIAKTVSTPPPPPPAAAPIRAPPLPPHAGALPPVDAPLPPVQGALFDFAPPPPPHPAAAPPFRGAPLPSLAGALPPAAPPFRGAPLLPVDAPLPPVPGALFNFAPPPPPPPAAAAPFRGAPLPPVADVDVILGSLRARAVSSPPPSPPPLLRSGGQPFGRRKSGSPIRMEQQQAMFYSYESMTSEDSSAAPLLKHKCPGEPLRDRRLEGSSATRYTLHAAKKRLRAQPFPRDRAIRCHHFRSGGVSEGVVDWVKIFQMQHLDGYWELTPELGTLLNFNADLFANVFLKSKGIDSLGSRARADILRLVATLLVLQMMRVEKLEEGTLLRTLFSLVESSRHRSARWKQVKRAVDWVCWADRQYPCICSRLEFGRSWESSTRQLLGFDVTHHSSPLNQLELRLSPVPLLAS